VYPVSQPHHTADERLHLYLTETLLKRIGIAADKEIARVVPTNDEPVPESPASRSRTSTASSRNRDGGSDSYHLAGSASTKVHKLGSVRGYKVLTFAEKENGERMVFDITTGTVYNTGAKSKISSGALLFDSESAAMSERFCPKAVSRHFPLFSGFE
jgi:hypothetical protein